MVPLHQIFGGDAVVNRLLQAICDTEDAIQRPIAHIPLGVDQANISVSLGWVTTATLSLYLHATNCVSQVFTLMFFFFHFVFLSPWLYTLNLFVLNTYWNSSYPNNYFNSNANYLNHTNFSYQNIIMTSLWLLAIWTME